MPEQPSESLWMGLDLGTQSARATVVTSSGQVVGRGSRSVTSRRDGRRHEQDPEEWWQAVAAASREALTDLPAAGVVALALCATSGTILLTDESGAPRTAGIMYDDTRAIEQADRIDQWASDLGLGYRIQPAWALPKLLWVLSEQAGATEDGLRLSHQADFVLSRLVGGRVPADSSHALKTGYDLIAGAWPEALFDELEIPPQVLPEVVAPGTPLGKVSREAADVTGIPEGAAVVAGMTDGCAAQLAAGVVEVGAWNSVLGTTLVLKGVSKEPVLDPLGVVYSHRSPEGTWLPGGASSVGAGILERTFPDQDLDHLIEAAGGHEPAASVAYPLLSRGERFPFVAPDAEAFLIGEPTDQAEHCAALLQGVAFVERLCFDYLDLLEAPTDGQISLTGGGSRNRYWCQLRSDVLGRAVKLPENTEGSLGMALLSSAVSRGRPIGEVAREMVRIREELPPRPDHTARFIKPYLQLVDELEERGWLMSPLAEHARQRAEA